MLEWVFIKLKFFKDLLDQQNQGFEWNLKEKTHGGSAEASGSKEDLPRRRTSEYWSLEARAEPSKARPGAQAICIYGLREEQDDRPAFQELWQKLSAMGLLIQSAQRTLLSLKIENQIL